LARKRNVWSVFDEDDDDEPLPSPPPPPAAASSGAGVVVPSVEAPLDNAGGAEFDAGGAESDVAQAFAEAKSPQPPAPSSVTAPVVASMPAAAPLGPSGTPGMWQVLLGNTIRPYEPSVQHTLESALMAGKTVAKITVRGTDYVVSLHEPRRQTSAADSTKTRPVRREGGPPPPAFVDLCMSPEDEMSAYKMPRRERDYGSPSAMASPSTDVSDSPVKRRRVNDSEDAGSHERAGAPMTATGQAATSGSQAKLNFLTAGQVDAFLSSCAFTAPPIGGSPAAVHASVHASVPRVSNKDQQRWKYKNFEIQRAPTLVINGTKYTDPKELPNELPRRKNSSTFFVTVNPNKVVPDDLKAVADDAWKEGLQALEQGVAENGTCIKFGPNDPATFAADRFEDVIIGRPKFVAKTEVGPKSGRLHAHLRVKVVHYSQVHLSIPKIQEIFKKAYDEAVAKAARKHTGGDMRRTAHVKSQLQINGLPYVDIELLSQSNASEIMLRYMFKDDVAACPDAGDDDDE
jgi:hypothetical protein